MEKSEIRKDYFLDKYVIIAPKRAKRPQKVLKKEDDQLQTCYFCPDTMAKDEKIISEVKGKDGKWKILTIENKFPALSLENPRAYGHQEIIIETPKHFSEIHELPIEEIVDIFDVYIDRFRSLSRVPGIKYVIVFKNEGGKAGASIPHAHSQVYALPMLPPEIRDEFLAYSKYKLEKSACPYCDIIKDETQKESRVIWEDENIFVLSPFASRSPYGAWFVPKRHFKSMTEMNADEKRSLAKALKLVLGMLDEIDVPYNYFFHNCIENEDYHMHLKLSPRPNVWAGLELGTGVIINPITPEYAAKYYRGEIEFETESDKKHLKIH